MAGTWRRDTSSVTATRSTVTSSSAAFGRWAFGIGQPRRDRRGRTDTVKGRSVRSGGNVLTTLSCSASGIFAICCDLTRPTITRLARTFQSTRTRRRREQYIPLVAFCLRHFLADFIICMVRQEKPDASSGRNSRLGKGNEPPHRESSLGLMGATTWVKRRHERRAGRNASEAIEPRDDSNPQADSVVLAGRQY